MSNPFTGEPDTKPKIRFPNGMPSGPAELYLFEIMIRDDDGYGTMYYIFANDQYEAERSLLDSFPKVSGRLVTTNMFSVKKGAVINGGKVKLVYQPTGRPDST